jgi:hypothetical protein
MQKYVQKAATAASTSPPDRRSWSKVGERVTKNLRKVDHGGLEDRTAVIESFSEFSGSGQFRDSAFGEPSNRPIMNSL